MQEVFGNKRPCLISMCICGVPCRYHGLTHKMGYRLYKEKLVAQLKEKYNLIPVCPEIMGGLPTPRPACNITWQDGEPKVTTRETGEDYTAQYKKGAEWTLWTAQVLDCKVAYLLRKSPACDPHTGVAGRLLAHNGIYVHGV